MDTGQKIKIVIMNTMKYTCKNVGQFLASGDQTE